MGDENPIRTLGDYSKPSHEGYKNTIEILVGNNVVPLRSDTIRLVQNGCSFHGLRSEDPNQHLKNFLKLVDSLDLDGDNRERTIHHHMGGSYYPIPCSILSTGKDRKTLLQYHDVLTTSWRIFIRCMDSFQGLTPKSPPSWHRPLALSLNFYDHVNPVTRRTIDQSAGGKLRDLNAEESWALLEDLALYDNESWNNPRDFAKSVKAIALPQDVPSTSDRYLIELENQVQHLMKAYLAPTQLVQVNKVSSSCKICSGPHDTQYCMKNHEQASVDYVSSRINKVGGKRFTLNHGPRYFNDATNTYKKKLNFNWAHTKTFTSPQGRLISVHSSSYQMKLEKALLDFDFNQEKRLSHLRTQLEQQQDDMIGNTMAPKSIAAISHDEREELRKNGITIPSILLSPKYLSPASIKELNKNPSAPKRLHFVNSIVILSTDSDTKEEDDSSINACDRNLCGMVKGKE
ncbi:hypothetical protein Tco_1494997 [Tanacetum coccineum]